MENLSKFAERLNELMEEENLTNKDLEKRSGCPSTSISAWRTKNVYPKLSNQLKLSKYFQCSIDYLFGLTDNRKTLRREIPLSFSERVRQLSESEGKTKYQIAKACEFHNSEFTKWLKKGLIPQAETLIKIADYLNCSVEYLLGLSDIR